MSGRTTPNRVAPLPARRARQMFFVADYDAVCAIMTTSLFLSPAPSLSLHLTSLPLTPRITARSVAGFFFTSLSFPLFLSRTFYLLPADEDKLCSCLSRLATTSSRTREEASKLLLFLTAGFRAIYVCTRRIFRRSFSRLLAYVFSFFFFFPLFRFLYVPLPLSDS